MLVDEEAERDAFFCHPESFGPKDLKGGMERRSFADAQDDSTKREEMKKSHLLLYELIPIL